ncbi:MAG TPA: hypothetical protein VMM18_07370, partial [Gemmatimonadaceae bacterium]|nr:hypothetical protein [Gemmatimonadaceae bacterium]
SVEVTIAEQNVPITIQLQQSAEQLRGTIQGSFGSAEIADGRINPDDTFRFSASVTTQGLTREAVFEGTITGNRMAGTVTVTGMGALPFSGTKP